MVEKTPCKMVKKRQFAGKKSLTGPGIRSPVLRITMTDQDRLSNLSAGLELILEQKNDKVD